ncbi:polysaccharide pyruvyl transferase family protein [Romboutsia lituseburensis]|uniref:polysaccharide pyruvyl transferase family protein n=1 Tax=Romboutsia lituseburensis TaxID=1537 RepID=UPI00215A479C|nr:polysaccharide pyruvyl transferase family protein [Romboutsia lituseburensis]MCR8746797.1 polysaccharide pyruvyl transferase family protein [Romboutsia lituseburensis]
MKKMIYKLLNRQKINKLKYKIGIIYNYKFRKFKNKKKILVSLIPTHGNLGDHAIAYASIKYLSEKFPNYEIIEINFSETYKYGKAYEKIINKDDIVCIIGGGNMGNQYMDDENIRRHMISKFKNVKVVSLPQTIYFTKDENGIKEFEISKKIYNENKNLVVIGREDKSYEIMKQSFTECKVIKNPDMVFYLNNKINIHQCERKNIMTCLRKDKESYISIHKKEEFLKQLKQKFKDIIVTDTVVDYQVSQTERERELFKLWTKFYNSRVVITDRLHGMIFCAITKTPCIVTRSLDHKVIESYKWIKDLNYIRMVDGLNFNEIEPIIEELMNLNTIDKFDLNKNYFDILIDYIK